MLNFGARYNAAALAVKALREGVATEQQWHSAAAYVAQASSTQTSVRGLQGHIQAAAQALQGIRARALTTGGGHWVPLDLHFQELDALQTFMDLHELQTPQPISHARCRVVRQFERKAA